MKAPLPEKVKIFSSGKALFLGKNVWNMFARFAHKQKQIASLTVLLRPEKCKASLTKSSVFAVTPHYCSTN